MDTKTIGRRAARGAGVVLLGERCRGRAQRLPDRNGSAAAGAGAEPIIPRPFDRTLIEKFGGRPVDRVAEEIERAIEDGELPSPDCISHRVVEHPDGGYHLVCVLVRD